jgi:hypothetical protein
MTPRAAAEFRKQIALGLDGNPREALKAKSFLRGLLEGGKIMISPGEDGSLWAYYSMSPALLLKAAGGGTVGRGRGI